jgi:hypothetical protein
MFSLTKLLSFRGTEFSKRTLSACPKNAVQLVMKRDVFNYVIKPSYVQNCTNGVVGLLTVFEEEKETILVLKTY